jgi:hypothetical protein
MSKLRCACGNIISDITDFLPYKAYFMSDQDMPDRYKWEAQEGVADALVKFIEARERGEQERFLAGHQVGYPGLSLSLKDIISWLISDPFGVHNRTIYECERWGRIYLQAGLDTNEHLGYVPQTALRGILRADGVYRPDPDA